MMQGRQSTRNTRAVLSKAQVLQIFAYKIESASVSRQTSKSTAQIAKSYGVTEKAIRDIWTGRTWFRETLHLEPSRPETLERLTRRPGRPKGSQDRQQRRKAAKVDEFQILVIYQLEYSHVLFLFGISKFDFLQVSIIEQGPCKWTPSIVQKVKSEPAQATTHDQWCITAKVPPDSASNCAHHEKTELSPQYGTLSQAVRANATPEPTEDAKPGSCAVDWLPPPCSAEFIDPFHDDWPHWDDAGKIEGKIWTSHPLHT